MRDRVYLLYSPALWVAALAAILNGQDLGVSPLRNHDFFTHTATLPPDPTSPPASPATIRSPLPPPPESNSTAASSEATTANECLLSRCHPHTPAPKTATSRSMRSRAMRKTFRSPRPPVSTPAPPAKIASGYAPSLLPAPAAIQSPAPARPRSPA